MIENVSAIPESVVTIFWTIIGMIGSAIVVWIKSKFNLNTLELKKETEKQVEINKINDYLNPYDSVHTKPPVTLETEAYTMSDEVKNSLHTCCINDEEWKAVITQINSNEVSGVYTYTLNMTNYCIQIMDGKIYTVYPKTGAGAVDQTKYNNTDIDIYAVYFDTMDEFKQTLPSDTEVVKLNRNSKIFVNVRHPKDARFFIKAVGHGYEYGTWYKSTTVVDEGDNMTYKEGVGNHAYVLNSPSPNGWSLGKYDITITAQQFADDIGTVYEPVIIHVDVE